ncbi:hypothetical protein HZS_902 [Henneguya salminicola]|nr:hypothetical protein HZS_902 [Henneguya salminicola]
MTMYKFRGSLMRAINQYKPRENRPLSPLFRKTETQYYIVFNGECPFVTKIHKSNHLFPLVQYQYIALNVIILFEDSFDRAVLSMIETIDQEVTFGNQR